MAWVILWVEVIVDPEVLQAVVEVQGMTFTTIVCIYFNTYFRMCKSV